MHRIPRGVAPLAVIAEPVYGAFVRLRNVLYESSLLQQRCLKSPVISIGNITTGGTGKTPLVIHTAKKIAEMGFTPAILSRGYGRPDPGIMRIVSPGESVDSPVSCMGDEPALIRRYVPEAWFGISKNRYSAGSIIEEQVDNPIFVLDDGFQHRTLHRDLDIVLIDPIQPLKSNRILPRGTLREPISGLRRGHLIIINSPADKKTGDPVQSVFEKLRLTEKLLYCEQIIEKLVPFELWEKAAVEKPNPSPPESVFLTAALGNPQRFHADVLNLGIRVCGTCFYRDHYRLQPGDWVRCAEMARKASANAILMTEKDAIKISEPPDFQLLVSVQVTRFPDEKLFTELLCRGIDTSLHVKR